MKCFIRTFFEWLSTRLVPLRIQKVPVCIVPWWKKESYKLLILFSSVHELPFHSLSPLLPSLYSWSENWLRSFRQCASKAAFRLHLCSNMEVARNVQHLLGFTTKPAICKKNIHDIPDKLSEPCALYWKNHTQKAGEHFTAHIAFTSSKALNLTNWSPWRALQKWRLQSSNLAL